MMWADQICDVLSYLHSYNPPVIFRDLKPGNIMISPDEKTTKLIDFGIARVFKAGATKDTSKLGTPGYAPPEQFGKNQTDARSDIYALGALLHQLLTLRDPGTQVFSFPPVRSINPKVSPRVDQTIQKAVANNPDQRWQSAKEFWNALRAPSFGGPQSSGQSANIPATAMLSAPAPMRPQPYNRPLPVPTPPLQFPFQPLIQVASPGDRIKAMIVDGLILGAIIFVIGLIFSSTGSYDYDGLMICSGLVMLVYYTWFHSRTGQTPGKRANNLRVVRLDGDKPVFLQILWRAFVFLVPLMSGLFNDLLPIAPLIMLAVWVIPLVNSDHRAIHDYLAGTKVIQG